VSTRRSWGPFAVALAAGLLGCEAEPEDGAIPIGLLLTYSGDLAANSVNSERALTMAIDAANKGGGLAEQTGQHRPVKVIARDTRGDLSRVTPAAQELVDAGAAVFIGPDTAALAVQVKALLGGRTMIMPSFTTSDSDLYKPNSWFVMGAGPLRVACELQAQLQEDGRRSPVVLMDPGGYNVRLGRELAFTYGLTQIFLPTDGASSEASLRPILTTPADAYVLATVPSAASSLLYTLAALGWLGQPSRWYLSPTLHTPALLETIPDGMMAGARGVATGTDAGGTVDFERAFAQRWQDRPLDDAYPFYDAAAVAVLALQHALVQESAIPSGTELAPHVVAVTRHGGVPVRWDQIGQGLSLLQQGQEIEYVGISGHLHFDITGQTPVANTKWWRIEGKDFVDAPSHSACGPVAPP
jgi:ABC-type branched-subunit amino acid transport system substrate-binding protein